MKKKFEKKKTAMLSLALALGLAALAVGCGASNNSASPIVTGVPAPLVNGVPVGAAGLATFSGNSCTVAGYSTGYYGYGGSQAGTTQTSTDGTQVCQITAQSNLPEYQGSRVFLGPNAPGYTGGNTDITLAPYDSVTIAANGNSSSGVFANFSGCGSAIPSGGVYGIVSGMSYFEITGSAVSVPGGAGGYLYVGLNQAPGSSGCMDLSVQVSIVRCVDVTGITHPCP